MRRLSLLLLLPGCSCGEDPQRPGPEEEGLAEIPGDPGRPVSEQLPDLDFPQLDPASYEYFGVSEQGAYVLSRRELVLVFAPKTTLEQANALLAERDARVVGSYPQGEMVLLRLPDATDPGPMLQAWVELREDPRVSHVLFSDGFMRPLRLPPRNVDPPRWDWHAPAGPDEGSWGLEAARFPQAWNLRETLLRRRTPPSTDLALVDEGFEAAHPDLTDAFFVQPDALEHGQREHGTMTSGIVDATWANRQGIEGGLGGLPGRLLAVSLDAAAFEFWPREDGSEVRFDRPVYENARVLWQFLAILALPARTGPLRQADLPSDLAPRAVNFSIGTVYWSYREAWGCVDPQRDEIPATSERWWPAGVPMTWRMLVEAWADLYRSRIDGLNDDAVLVAAAGNDGFVPADASCDVDVTYEAMDTSPITHLAVRDGGRYLAVMASAAAGGLTSFSQRAGTVLAPGECLRSLEAGGENYDDPGCPGADATDGSLATGSGTSFAAPMATALAGLVAAVDEDLGGAEIAEIVRTEATAAWGIDAFAAVAAAWADDEDLFERLADIDDGTVDGRRRTVRDRGNTVIDDRFGHDDAYASAAAEEPAPIGDGLVDMSDFRALRDCFLLASDEPGFELDGAADHSKKDLNQDGAAETPEREDAYPRCDLNGDGRAQEALLPSASGYERPAALAGMTDLQVLQEVWPSLPASTEDVTAADLPGLLRSADLEIHADRLLDMGAVWVEVTITAPELDPVVKMVTPLSACDHPDGRCLLVTVQTAPEVLLRAVGQGGPDGPIEAVPVRLRLRPGEDVRIDLAAGSLLFNRDDELVLYDTLSEQETVIADGWFWRGYCFSPDGSHVLASRWRGASWDLVWMGADGSGEVAVAADPDLDEVEPRCPAEGDGDRYFYLVEERDDGGLPVPGGVFDLFRLDREVVDAEERWSSLNLTDDGDLRIEHGTYAVRPDGEELAFTEYSDAWTPSPCPLVLIDAYGPEGEGPRPVDYSLPAGAPGDVFLAGCPAPMNLAWSPDGARIYIGDSGSRWTGPVEAPYEEIYVLFVEPAAGGGLLEAGTHVVANPSDPFEEPRYDPPWNDRTFTASPAGGFVFSNFPCGAPPWNGILHVGDGGGQRLVDDLCGYEIAYSPDGRFVAYTAIGADDGVHVFEAGPDDRRISDGERPVWRPTSE